MKLKINQIKVKNRFRTDMGDLEPLIKSIGDLGLLHPIVVQANTHRLIAGGRRLEACKILKMVDVPVTIINIDDIVMGEFQENMVRKDFSLQEGVSIWNEVKSRQDQLEKKGKLTGRARENAAKFMGISHGQLQKMIEIDKAVKENPDKHGHILDDIEHGQSINYAHKSLNNVVRQDTPTPDLPTEEFELIEIDPPWAYDLDLVASPPYKTMNLEEMKTEIPKLPAYKNCVLFMWATNPKLKEAMELMEFWGFEYKTNMAWGKYKDGKVQTNVGYYLKGAHELLLIGVKGSPGVPGETVRVPSLQLHPRTQHSVKPDVFHEIMETYYPAKKKISMFARRNRDGWTTWGDDEAVAE